MADATVTIRGGAGNAVQIQGRAVDAAAPADTNVLAWSASDSEWEPTAAGGGGSSEWTDTGSVLHPAESTVDNVVVGGTTTANSDIVLGVDGAAVFNEQSADVDFRVESNGNTHMLFVDGGGDTVGIGCTPVEAASSNPSCLLVISNKSTPSTPAQYSPLVVEHDSAASYVNIIAEDNVSGSYTGLKLGDASNPDEASIVYDAHGKRMYFTGNGESNANATMVMDSVANTVGINVIAPGEALTVDGAIAVKSQTTAPSVTHDYAKLYAFDPTAPQFGTASLDLDGTGDYFHVAYDAANPDFNFDANPFTVEGWFKFRAASATSMELISIGIWSNDGLELAWTNANLIKLYIDSGTPVISESFTPTLNQWYHIAVTRDSSSDCRLFVDGTQLGAAANSTGTISGANGGVNGLKVGTEATVTADWNGWIDEVRLSDNARYTSNFTPSTVAFVSDVNTMGLYHFDGVEGATSGAGFDDSSSNGQDGSAVGHARLETGVSELYAQDSDGNETKLSPHNNDGDWEYYSKNSRTGKTVRINMEKMIRDIEQLTGKDYIKDE